MEFFEILTQLLQNIVFGPDLGVEVNMALGPLAAAGIAIGGQLVGKGISHLLNTGKRRRQRRRANRAERRMNKSLGRLNEGIRGTRQRGEEAFTLADQTNAELYGAERQRRTRDVQDRIGQQTAGARQAISRSLLAGGGDVTGGAGVTLNRIQQQANSNIGQALSQIENEIARRGENYRRFQTQRGDQLMSSALAAESNQFGALSGREQQAEMLRIQQQQAQEQMGFDIGSSASNLAALALTQQPTG